MTNIGHEWSRLLTWWARNSWPGLGFVGIWGCLRRAIQCDLPKAGQLMKRWRIISTLCVCALCLTATPFAAADYVGLVHVTKVDPDIVNLCNNADGDFVPSPLRVCNVLAQFDDPTDRLLSVGNADVSTSDALGYFHHPFGGNTSPACILFQVFPDLICDSFVTIGVKCNDGNDSTSTDSDFDSNEFNNNGHVVGGWFNANPLNGQGDAGQDPPNQNLQVLFLQLSVATGGSITGTISVFAKINDEVVAFENQVVDCVAVKGCPPGEACDDGNPCTVGDTCDEDANCVGTDVDCSGAGDQCNTASCDPNGADGNCDVLTPLPDGTECDDDDACTDADQCTAGACGGTVVDCSGAGDQCNAASCDPNGAEGNCDILTPLPDGTACNDDDACTDADQCTAGACGGTVVDCSGAGDQCNAASCDPNGAEGNCDTLTPLPDGTECDDGAACTENDQCTAGTCGGTDVDCSGAGDQCNSASCDPNGAEGNCDILTPLADGTACDDDQLCTENDQCTAGTCGGTDVDCSGAGEECKTASCDPNGGEGNCDILTPLKDGTECDDGDLCTGNDTCSSAQCAGLPVDCSEFGGPCGIASCDPAGAQINCNIITPVKDGTPCDDGEACTAEGLCVDGQCLTEEADCNDNGVPDCQDIEDMTSGDCDGDGVPDECQLPKSSGGLCTEGCAPDCDGNGEIDSCEIARCTPESEDYPACDDCNLNEVPDGCDVDRSDPDGDGHVSADENGDGVPDECIDPEPEEGGFNWSDDIWDLSGENPKFPYPDNSQGVGDLSVTLAGEELILLVDVDVVVPSLRLIDGVALDVTQRGEFGDLAIVDTGILDGNLLIEGTLTVGEGRLIEVDAEVRIGEDGIYQSVDGFNRPPGGDMEAGDFIIECGGSVILQGSMDVETSGDMVLDGEDDGKGDCTPPDFESSDQSTASAGGDFIILGSGDIEYHSSEPLHLGGDFDNQSTDEHIFNWRDGGIRMNGPLHTFEAAGEDRGPWPAGLVDNFTIGTLILAEETNVQVVDAFDNQEDGTTACDEALYVEVLEVGPGATLITQGCRVYYNGLINNGSIPELGTDVLQILEPCPADLNSDGAVNAADLATLLGAWGPCPEPCEPGDPADTCPADLDGDCLVAASDLATLLGSWGPCP